MLRYAARMAALQSAGETPAPQATVATETASQPSRENALPLQALYEFAIQDRLAKRAPFSDRLVDEVLARYC